MKTLLEHEFTSNPAFYIINENNEVRAYSSLQYYYDNKELFKDKILIIANPKHPIYFRKTK